MLGFVGWHVIGAIFSGFTVVATAISVYMLHDARREGLSRASQAGVIIVGSRAIVDFKLMSRKSENGFALLVWRSNAYRTLLGN